MGDGAFIFRPGDGMAHPDAIVSRIFHL